MLPLHAQQQSIVGAAWIIHAVQVDHTRLDQPTQFQQMMPIAPVAGESRGVEAQDGPDLARAKPRHQPVEAGPGRRSARRAAKIVIDHLDVLEAAAPRLVDEIVLPPLAFEIGLDLRLCGLPHVDYRLALQNGRGKEISVRHRFAPPSRRRPPASRGWPGRRSLSSARWHSSSRVEESNTILSWCGARDRAGVVEIGFGELRILFLLGDSRNRPGSFAGNHER